MDFKQPNLSHKTVFWNCTPKIREKRKGMAPSLLVLSRGTKFTRPIGRRDRLKNKSIEHRCLSDHKTGDCFEESLFLYILRDKKRANTWASKKRMRNHAALEPRDGTSPTQSWRMNYSLWSFYLNWSGLQWNYLVVRPVLFWNSQVSIIRNSNAKDSATPLSPRGVWIVHRGLACATWVFYIGHCATEQRRNF